MFILIILIIVLTRLFCGVNADGLGLLPPNATAAREIELNNFLKSTFGPDFTIDDLKFLLRAGHISMYNQPWDSIISGIIENEKLENILKYLQYLMVPHLFRYEETVEPVVDSQAHLLRQIPPVELSEPQQEPSNIIQNIEVFRDLEIRDLEPSIGHSYGGFPVFCSGGN